MLQYTESRTYLLTLHLGLESHEVIMSLSQVVHVARHRVVACELHLELGDDGRDLLDAGQRDLNGFETLDVERGVRPDAVPLVKHLVQARLLLGSLLGNVAEQVLHLGETLKEVYF